MKIQQKIKAFAGLGKFLGYLSLDNKEKVEGFTQNQVNSFNELIDNSCLHNGWFIADNVRYALLSIADSLSEQNINKWIGSYAERIETRKECKTIGVVMAGNLPLVGFHDFFCVLMSGNKFLGKLSSQDKQLLPAVSDVLIEIAPGFKDYIEFTEERLESFDAVIATGSNNTSRYFEYYFGKYPNIIRKNRNGVGVITGNETEDDLKALGKDIFLYFGLGCRSISKLFVPKNYLFDNFFKAIEECKAIIDHHKYFNNYEYNKAIYLVNSIKHLDNGFLLLKEDKAIASPVSVVYYEYYSDLFKVNKRLQEETDAIQCIVSNDSDVKGSTPFGMAQSPQLWDYADGVDTMEFLLSEV